MTITAQLADGRTLEFPDGTDPAVIQATVKRLVGGRPAEPAPDPLEGMPGWQRALVGAGAEMTDWGQGIKEMFARPLNALGVVSDETMAGIDADRAEKKALDARLASDTGAQVGRLTANVAGALLPTTTVRGAMALGAGLGALAPTEGEGERVVNMLLSGALGGIGQAAGNKLAAWMQGGSKGRPPLSPDELSIVREAQRRGYDLMPDQITKSKSAQALRTQLEALPGSSGAMAERIGGQRERFAKDLFGTMGEQAPDRIVPAGTSANIRSNFNAKYAQATQGVRLTQDAQLMDDMVAAFDGPLTAAEKKKVGFYINQVPAEFDGAFYQSWRSRVGKAAEGADPELKGALKQVQAALDSAFDRQAPAANVRAMNEVRKQYRNFKDLDPLIKGAEGKGEAIGPLTVASRVASSGNLDGELAEVARIGRLIGREGSNSGTSQNQAARDLLTGKIGGVGFLAGAGAGAASGGDWQSALSGGGGGAALGAGAALLGPRIGANVYLSKALRDSTQKGAEKATKAAFGPQSALAQALRRIGADSEPVLEALARGGLIGAPALGGE